jgi:hypothetical protein
MAETSSEKTHARKGHLVSVTTKNMTEGGGHVEIYLVAEHDPKAAAKIVRKGTSSTKAQKIVAECSVPAKSMKRWKFQKGAFAPTQFDFPR